MNNGVTSVVAGTNFDLRAALSTEFVARASILWSFMPETSGLAFLFTPSVTDGSNVIFSIIPSIPRSVRHVLDGYRKKHRKSERIP